MRFALLLALTSFGCFDLTLPDVPGPGTLQARLVYQVPGQRTLLPAAGATMELVSSSLSARADAEGRVLLEGLTVTEGVVLIRFDLDGDGKFERQRALDLKALKAGKGRDVALGEVLLNRNASLSGIARREDLVGSGGHGNISVFIPELGFQTLTGDNGEWRLEELPEGSLPIAFFTHGYEPESLEVIVTSGNGNALRDVLLHVAAFDSPATASGLVVQDVSGAPLAGVTVRASSATPEVTAQSGADGKYEFSNLTAGVYSLAFEREGYETAAVLSVLLGPGPNTLPPIAMHAGTSTRWTFAPQPDAGITENEKDAGSETMRDAGSDSDEDGGVDAGEVDAGQLDAGQPDAGPQSAGCTGLCAAGFTCGADGLCRSTGCESQSCALCREGRCLSAQCSTGPACLPGQVCDLGTCVALECVGVSCPSGRCAAGSCLPTQCGNSSCATGLVCSGGRCVHPSCVGKVCAAGSTCAEGWCLPNSGLLDLCNPGFVRKDGRCVEAACQGATCAPGASCRAGSCVAEGLFAAGFIGEQGNLATWDSLVAANLDGTWRRLNVTTLPKVRQLAFSASGAWLFAVGEDDSLRRSQDGVTWQTVWAGTLTSGGQMKSIAVFPNGELYAACVGAYQTPFSQVIRSTDDGASWTTVTTPVGGFNGLPDVLSVAPPNLFSFFNGNSGSNTRAVQQWSDGGYVLQGFGNPPRLVFDPNGFGPTMVAEASLWFMDGGLSGAVTTGLGQVVYSEAPRTLIWAAATNQVWKSPNHGASWGSRSTSTPAALDLTSLVQGVDGTLYAGNRKGTPSLLSSVDDGDTWEVAAPELPRIPTLTDRYDAWAPDASYYFQSLVIPTVPNGFYYSKGGTPSRSSVEPQWKTDGGITVDAEGFGWTPYLVTPMRVTALASRSCGVGLLRCGGGCVSVANDAANCGACGNACSSGTTCSQGRCQTNTQLAASSGCADGTREGFVDLERSPDLAACAGTYSGSLMGSGADALCAAGWHVCTDGDTEPRAVSMLQATGFPGCYAMRASTDDGDGCEPLDCADPNHDDIAGMGAGCAGLSGVVNQGLGCFSTPGISNAQCCSISRTSPGCPQRGESGVLCCH